MKTNRELWRDIMNYRPVDRLPVSHWLTWPETRDRWVNEGMARDADEWEELGALNHFATIHIDDCLYPAFEREVQEETDEWVIAREPCGTIMKSWKHKSCIPHSLGFSFEDADDWPAYKERLQPDVGRISADLHERIAAVEASGQPISIGTGSLMGWTRDWMGVENMSYLMYDDEDVYADVVDTIANLICWSIDQVVPHMHITPDLGFGFEDICGKTGPLVSLDIFDRCVAPGYRKIRAKLESYGIHIYGIDSDGKVEPMVQNWLDAGVNLIFPIEPGTWKATPEDLREKFGDELLMVGGFNKYALEQGREAIDAELARHRDLCRSGGYVMIPDHLITPDVALDDYRYFLDQWRAIRL